MVMRAAQRRLVGLYMVRGLEVAQLTDLKIVLGTVVIIGIHRTSAL